MKKALIVLGVAALASASFAQGGQGRGGGRMMMMGGGIAPMGMLVNRQDVQKELGITVEQRSKLREMQEKMQSEMRARFQGGPGQQGQPGGPPDMEEMRRTMRAQEEQSNKALGEVLSADQMKRLKELSVQRAGMRAVMSPDVQKELGLNAEQVKKVETLQTKQREAMQAVMEKARNQEIEFSEVRELMEKNGRIMDEELGKVLTDAQRGKLKEMGGKPFQFDENEQGGFGGRRGRD